MQVELKPSMACTPTVRGGGEDLCVQVALSCATREVHAGRQWVEAAGNPMEVRGGLLSSRLAPCNQGSRHVQARVGGFQPPTHAVSRSGSFREATHQQDVVRGLC